MKKKKNLIRRDCSVDFSDTPRQGGITLVSPNQRDCGRSITALSCGSAILPPGSQTALGMRGCMVPIAERSCHSSGLINEDRGPVFNVFNMGRRRGRHTLATHLSL